MHVSKQIGHRTVYNSKKDTFPNIYVFKKLVEWISKVKNVM